MVTRRDVVNARLVIAPRETSLSARDTVYLSLPHARTTSYAHMDHFNILVHADCSLDLRV
jgi:hypothetical protein